MPAPFNGTLRSNEIFGSIFNMIISQQVFADNIAGVQNKLVGICKVDGSLYGDTKLYYSTDVLPTHAWGGDSEAANLLSLDRPADPFCQKITLDTFRQIRLTVDNYLSKRAWSTEGAFAQFTSVMLGWIGETKKVYDATLVNSFICGTTATIGKQDVKVTLPTASGTDETTEEAYNRLVAETIAYVVANTFVELTDISRDYNDLAFLRSYAKEDLVVVWNSAYVNMIKKLDLPTIYHEAGLMDKFEEIVAPERYFSKPVNTTLAISSYVAGTANAYAEVEMDCVYGTSPNTRTVHYFKGELIKKTVPSLTSASTYTLASYTPDGGSSASTFAANDYRLLNTMLGTGSQVCKIIHKESVPYMSAFETGTSFFNPRSLTENHYLTFGHNTLERLLDKPFVTIEIA